MATLHLTATTTVADLRKEFNEAFGAQVKVYNGRSRAAMEEILSNIGLSNTGEFKCRSSLTVASFIERMQNEFGLKVKVYTCDEWVAVLDGLTLESAGKVKKNAVKADMENMIAYQHSENDNATQNPTNRQENEELEEEEWVESLDEGVEVGNVYYSLFPDKSASADFVLDEDDNSPIIIPEKVSYKGEEYVVTSLFIGSCSAELIEIPSTINFINDDLFTKAYALKIIVTHKDPKDIICTKEDDDEKQYSIDECNVNNIEIRYISENDLVSSDVRAAHETARAAIEDSKKKKGFLSKIIDSIIGK